MGMMKNLLQISILLLLILTSVYEGVALSDDASYFQQAKTLCDSGDASGCSDLGYLYYQGKGVKQDYFKAADLFKKACDARNPFGCDILGMMYETGQGVRQSLGKARELYGKECDLKEQLGCINYARLNK